MRGTRLLGEISPVGQKVEFIEHVVTWLFVSSNARQKPGKG